jgi:hypothetical protein
LDATILWFIGEHVEEGRIMPARGERIYLYPDLHSDRQSEPGRILDFPLWWDRREFFNRFKAREVDCSNPVDDKSAYLMFVDDAFTFDKECLERTATELGTIPPHIRERQAEFVDALRRSKWVIVESYEWD